jgi:hypothetical protein
VSRLGAQTAPDSPVSPLPRGAVVVRTATAPDVDVRLRDLSVRTVGGRAFLVGLPAEGRQLTAAPPLVWIPVDAVIEMNESGTGS